MFRAIKGSLKLALRPALDGFERQLRDPGAAQRTLLDRIVGKLAKTEYGRFHRVRPGDRYDDFVRKVPVAGYDDLSQWIDRQQSTESNILIDEPVIFYELTSGSSSAAKQIPYTGSLKASFNRMFLLWLGDLLRDGPNFRTGKVYLSISPIFRQRMKTPLGVPIGLDEDTEYLSGWARRLLNPYMVVHREASRIDDADCYLKVLSASLLSEPWLESISIWNPSLLEIILDYIAGNPSLMASILTKGSYRCGPVEFNFKSVSKQRIDLILNGDADWRSVWPELKLISCWTGAHAEVPARRVAGRFPGIYLQGKGLLATEAPMTIPFIRAEGCVPLPSEVFYEFRDARGDLHQLHELQTGAEYEIIITQQGGLYRYRIGDMVRVSHRYLETPCLEFIGRSDDVCDLVGEKLNEGFVRQCIERTPMIHDSFPVLLPRRAESGRWRYVLLIDRQGIDVPLIRSHMENELCRACHYRIARQLGQLEPLEVMIVSGLRDLLFDYFAGRGVRLGDIKDRQLIRGVDIEGLTGYLSDRSVVSDSGNGRAFRSRERPE